MKCEYCETELKLLFSSWYCPNDCKAIDFEPQSSDENLPVNYSSTNGVYTVKCSKCSSLIYSTYPLVYGTICPNCVGGSQATACNQCWGSGCQKCGMIGYTNPGGTP